jgi:hypothetical protein
MLGQHPWPACSKKARGRTTGTTEHRPSLRNGLNDLYVISSGTGCLAPVLRQRASHVAQGASTGTPGPHDFAVRIVLFVRMDQPRCNPIRPSHPAPNARDDRETPLLIEAGCQGYDINF